MLSDIDPESASCCERNFFNVFQEFITEDCLVLTVTVPASYPLNAQNGQLLPVMFWIHGGGYVVGSSNDKLYNASSLSNTTNSIVVTINYRLGENT